MCVSGGDDHHAGPGILSVPSSQGKSPTESGGGVGGQGGTVTACSKTIPMSGSSTWLAITVIYSLPYEVSDVDFIPPLYR